MNKNRMEGAAEPGEWAIYHEALVTKAVVAWMRRLCDEGVRSYLGRYRLMPERATAQTSGG
jgi:hypothetical protein